MLFAAKQQIEVNISQDIVENLSLSVCVINLSTSYLKVIKLIKVTCGKTGLASGLIRCACASELMLNLGCVVVCVKEQRFKYPTPPHPKRRYSSIYIMD